MYSKIPILSSFILRLYSNIHQSLLFLNYGQYSVIVFAKLYKYRAVTGIRKTTKTGKEKRVRPINFD